jgi:hypothetical protein
MSQHSQRAQYGPTVGTIVTGVVLTVGGGTGVAYMFSGPLTARAIVGALLGAVFTVLMGFSTLERAVERRVALDRIERQEAARREDALRAERERAACEPHPAEEPDPVAAQPLPEEPDPLMTDHRATGGADPVRSAAEAPKRYDTPRYSGPLYPPVEGAGEPGRYPRHPRPVDQPNWADRDWPTETIPVTRRS